MDEKSGMNFSEYMALLSGNTDLLDKAKLEKADRIARRERKSFNKGKRDSEFKLESKTGELRNNTAFIDAMTEDWNHFLSVVQTDKEGNHLNIIKVDGWIPPMKKVIGKRLQEIAKNATTGGLYAGRRTLRFSDKGGERKGYSKRDWVHRQPLRGRGTTVHLQQRASGDG